MWHKIQDERRIRAPQSSKTQSETKYSSNEAYFTPNILYQIVTSTLVNLQGNKVFSASLRKEFMNYGFEIPQEDASEFCELKTIYEAFRTKMLRSCMEHIMLKSL